MARALLRFLKLKIVGIGLLFIGVSTPAMGQAAGDIAFIGIDGNNQNITLVALADLPANTTVYVTDVSWNGNRWHQKGAVVVWHTGIESISPGTVIRLGNLNAPQTYANIGSLERRGVDSLSLDGILFAYVNEKDSQYSPKFLAAVAKDRSFYNGFKGTLKGTGLTAGKEAIILDDTASEAYYSADRRDYTKERFLQLIGDTKRNWQYDSTGSTDRSSGLSPFSVRPTTPGKNADSRLTIIPLAHEPGWRSVSVPAQQTTFGQLFGNIRTQISYSSDNTQMAPSVLWWNESQSRFAYPVQKDDYLMPGRGYYVYRPEVYKMTASQKTTAAQLFLNPQGLQDQIVNVSVSATDANESGKIDGYEGFNLLGNPFGKPIAVEKVIQALRKVNTNVSPYVYLWNPDRGNGNGGFEALAKDTSIAPFRAYWVRYLDRDVNGMVRLDRTELVRDDEQQYSVDVAARRFELRLGYEDQFDSYGLELREEGEVGEDYLDAYKLFSLNESSANLFSKTLNNNRLAINVLPLDLNQRLEIPLSFSAPDWPSLSFRWHRADAWPQSWEMMLVDQQKERTINLKTERSYTFIPESSPAASLPEQPRFLNNWEADSYDNRFSLVIDPTVNSIRQAAGEQKQPTSLKPNYPNPFTSVTNIPFELAERTEVTLTIWNMIGQKVATLVDGVRGPNDENVEKWNAANMPSGMYIARLEVGGEVFTRKMTLIK